MNTALRTDIGSFNGAPGFGAALLRCGGSVPDAVQLMRTAAPLPLNAQLLIDKAVVDVGLERLIVAGELQARGLVYPLTNALGVLDLYSENESKAGFAQRSMEPRSRGEAQLLDRAGVHLPIYCTWDDFNFGIRVLLAAERSGAPLDVSMTKQAVRRVNESIEDAVINGSGVVSGGNQAYGLLNEPNVNRTIYGSNLAWDNASKTGDEILTDILAMITKLQAAHKYGPYTLILPTAYGLTVTKDFKTYSTTTILQRIKEIDTGSGPITVITADRMPTDRTVLMQMTSDVAELVVGQVPTVINWGTPDGMSQNFLVLAIVVPRIRSDYDKNSGICVGFTS